MVLKRLIPVLMIKNDGLVITESFNKSKYIGDPINIIKIFNDKEADEIVVIDISASKAMKEPNFDLLGTIAQEAFMPLTYGGGVTKLEQIRKILYFGYEKVLINNAALNNMEFIKKAVSEYGSSSIVGCIDVKKNIFGKYKVYNHVVGKIGKLNPVEYAKSLQEAGVGELLINSVDNDGLRNGYDLNLIDSIVKNTNISIIYLGGAGSYEDIIAALNEGIDAAAAGSLFTLYGKHKAVLVTYDKAEVEDYLETDNL